MKLWVSGIYKSNYAKIDIRDTQWLVFFLLVARYGFGALDPTCRKRTMEPS